MKVTNAIYPMTTHLYGHGTDTGCTTQDLGSSNYSVGEYKVSEGVNIPHFHRRKFQGELLPFTHWRQYEADLKTMGGFTATGVNVSGTPCSPCNPCRDYWTDGPIPITNLSPLSLGMQTAFLDAEEGLVADINDATSKIYDKGWDALTFVAELKETVRMFEHALSTFVYGFVLPTRNRWIQYPHENHGWEGPWLAWRYGWRILFYDIQDISRALHRIGKSKERHRAKASGSFTKGPTNASVPTTHAYLSYTSHTDIEWSYRPLANSVVDVSVPAVWVNPIATAWELIPYSFVVDWFLGVGNWIKANTILLLSTASAGATGVLMTKTTHVYPTGMTYSPSYGGFKWSGSYTLESTLVETVTLRVPTSVASLSPQPSVKLNTSKIIDLLALLKQLTRI